VVAYASGFSSLSDFGRAFRREYGMSPGDLRAAAEAGTSPAPQWAAARTRGICGGWRITESRGTVTLAKR